MEILLIILIWLGCGVVGAMIMSGRGRSGGAGFALGVLLGPIGLIIALLIRPSIEHEAQRQLQIEAVKRRQQSHSEQTSSPLSDLLNPENGQVQAAGQMRIETSSKFGKQYYRWKCTDCDASGPWLDENEATAESVTHACA